MSNPKLFLLDAMALIYRAHFAFAKTPRITSTGMNTSATFGFVNTLLEILQKEKPTHLAVGFDLEGPTVRHHVFEAYKGQRQEQPEDITLAIPYVKRILEAMNIPILAVPTYEADDSIGTMAWMASDAGMDVYMMTPDKDYCQLVRDNVFVYKPAFMGKGVEILGVKEVLEKWEIASVAQVTDILGLMGDAVDNIPGIPGIGDKTAKKLIQEYGSVENLIANAHQLKGKQAENVINFAHQGIQSKSLATIITDVPLDFKPEDLILKEINKEAVSALFAELEFRTLGKRLFGEEVKLPAPAAPKKGKKSPEGQTDLFAIAASETLAEIEVAETKSGRNAENTPHRYFLFQTESECTRLLQFLLLQNEVCFDSETDSLDTLTAQIVGLSFSWKASEAYYLAIPEDFEAAKNIISILKPFFENESIVKIGQNLKYDIGVLRKYGIEVKGTLYDTMLAHYLLEPDQRHGMDALAQHYLGYEPISITELIGKKGKEQGSMRDVSLPLITEYAAEDADITLQLKLKLDVDLQAQGLNSLLLDVEGPLIHVLNDMEQQGIRLDIKALSDSSIALSDDMAVLEKQIFESAGESFNISSPKQLGLILFEKLKLDPKAKKTATGQYQTGEEVLSKLAYAHELPALILDYRELQKLKSTYVDALPALIHKDTGRIHTTYNQAVAATGRLSSNNPNLQNIPIRTARGREIRKAFVPRNEDYVIFSADYSQIELRIMAAFSQDETMLQAFQDGKDIHTITASKLYKVALEDVDSDMRRKAKTANFGIIYGISAFGLSQRLNIPRKEAAEIIQNYFEEFPKVKSYMDGVVLAAQENGYVETILGRRRYLPDITSANVTMRGFAERNAINAPIQGSAADMIKVAMINIYNWMKTQPELKSKMVLQVHDELVFDAHKDELDLLIPQVSHFMKTAISLPVPMEVGVGTGKNWLDAH